MSGSYPPGVAQRDHDRAFSEMGPDPDEELRLEHEELEAFWNALIMFAEEFGEEGGLW